MCQHIKRRIIKQLSFTDLTFSLSLSLIDLVGADEAATMATTTTAEWRLCVPIRRWRSSSFPTAATATATPLHVSTYGPPPPAPGLNGV